MVRGAGQGLGFQALMRDLGLEVPLRVWTDSSVAMGICGRQGLGKLRHLDTHTLWVQQAVRTGRLELKKVPGEQNPADLLTKHSQTAERLAKLVALFNCEFRTGRAVSAPQLRRSEGVKTTLADGHLDTGDALALTSQGEMEDPIMPHLVLGSAELNHQYPSLKVIESDPFMEPDMDECDLTFKNGMVEAQRIAEATRQCGRTRYEGMRRPETPDAATAAAASASSSSATRASSSTASSLTWASSTGPVSSPDSGTSRPASSVTITQGMFV